MNTKDLQKIIKFVSFAEKLKTELRHGKTSAGRNESVADHSWRVTLLTILISPYLQEEIDLEKAVKMALIHDLPEALTGDEPYFLHENKKDAKQKKYTNEKLAMMKICETLPENFSEEFYSLWIEYEKSNSKEARLVKAIDKMEAQIQHNEADFSVWNEYDYKFALTRLNAYCDFDIALKKLRELIQEESKQKMLNNGVNFFE